MPGPTFNVSSIVDACDDLASWDYVANFQPSIADEAGAAYQAFADSCLKFQADIDGAGRVAQITKNFSLSFAQNDTLGIAIYIPTRLSGSNMGISVRFSDAADFGTGTGRWRYANIGAIATGIATEQQGWNFFPCTFGDGTTLDGTPTIDLTWASCRMDILSSGSVAREFYVAGMVRGRSRPTILFTFDDGADSAYSEGHAYANAAGIPLTHFLIADLIDGANYVTKAQVREMVLAGDEVGVHDTASWEDNPSNIAIAANALRDMFGYPFLHAAYPGGAHGQTNENYTEIQAACVAAGLSSARTVGPGTLVCPAVFSPLTMPATVNLQTGVSLADAKAQIQRAILHGLTCVVLGHKLESSAAASTWAISDWQALIDYVVTLRDRGLVDTKNISEWWRGDTRPAA